MAKYKDLPFIVRNKEVWRKDPANLHNKDLNPICDIYNLNEDKVRLAILKANQRVNSYYDI